MFYLLVIPVLIMSFFMVRRLLTMRKHDMVLFRFCQTRRDLMGILRRDNIDIPREKYIALRKLGELLNITIHNYDEIKLSLFNGRKFFQYLKQFESDNKKIEKIKIPDDQEVVDIYNKYAIATLKAFLAYTPFIRSQLLLSVVPYLLNTIGVLGIKRLDNYVKTLTQIKIKIHEFGIPLRAI